MPTTRPDGSADVITRRTKPGCARSLLGASDRMNAGIPMVNQAAIVTWIGWNGNSNGSDPKILDARPARPTRIASSTEFGVLERQHVVDTVAGHCDRVPTRLKGVHHGTLLVRPHSAERRVLLERVRQLVGLVGQLAGIH